MLSIGPEDRALDEGADALAEWGGYPSSRPRSSQLGVPEAKCERLERVGSRFDAINHPTAYGLDGQEGTDHSVG